MAAAFASACLAGGRLCKKGAKCEPDPNSCMGRGTNTLYGYIVANAHDASWNGEYSPGDPIQYLDNARRYDLGGVKSRGRTLYRANSQWRLATIDQAGYAQGPLGDSAAATEWYEYGKEKKITGMYTAKTILASPKPAWTSGVACVESAKDLQYFEKADAEHKGWWRRCGGRRAPTATGCGEDGADRIRAARRHLLPRDRRRPRPVHAAPILSELPGFVIFGPDFMKKAVFSTPDADDMLRCLDQLKLAMPCDMTEVKHGGVAARRPQPRHGLPQRELCAVHNRPGRRLLLSGAGLGQYLRSSMRITPRTAAAPAPRRPRRRRRAAFRRCSRRPTAAAPRCRRRPPPPRGRARRAAPVHRGGRRDAARAAESRKRGGERRARASGARSSPPLPRTQVEPSTANATRGTGLVCLAPVCRGFM